MVIPITRPLFGPEELAAVQRPLKTGWVVQGPCVREFEERFSSFTGARHSVATSTCTSALHIAVAALGLRPGDEVIVPAFTWISTPNVVEYQGATATFCDIDAATFNIDVTAIEARITPRTVGILPVHLFGLCADMPAILDIAGRHGLWVVEDAACAFGARLHGRHAGTFGNLGCFSFHPRKSITTGEGGMITTQDDGYASLARSLRDHGASRSDLDRHSEGGGFLLAQYDRLGFNYRMTDIQGALGCAQMDRARLILEERYRRARLYDQALHAINGLETPKVPDGYDHGYQSYVCWFRPESPSFRNLDRLHERRNRMMSCLESLGIATRQGTHAPVIQGYYSKKYALRPQDFPNAVFADRLTLSLPLFPQMTDDEQDLVSESLRELFDA
jgi:perosamine synthetase